MSKVKKIVLTGGGTAGHVTPNIALLPELKKQGYDVHYIGSYVPSVVSTYSVYVGVDIQVDEVAFGQFVRMLFPFQVFFPVGPYTET